MADVKWIKITTDMFDNRKIKHLRKLPDGNNCVLIWVMLLTMAGRCNANGMIFLTETFPYSTKMLADELDFEENTVKMALATFELMGMIEKVGDFISIKGWNEYQNVDRLTEIREYNRLAQQKSRAKKKLLANVNDMSMTSQSCHETDIDKEVDKEVDKDKETKKSNVKRFVPPTLEEVTEYINENMFIVNPEIFYDYYQANGWTINKNKMKDWKATVRNWNRRDQEKKKVKSQEDWAF